MVLLSASLRNTQAAPPKPASSAAVTGLQVFAERAVLFREQPGVLASAAITAVRCVLLAWLASATLSRMACSPLDPMLRRSKKLS